MTRIVLALGLLLASPAHAQCAPAGAEITRYDDLQPGARGWIDVRWDGRTWVPARQLPMPYHHASRIAWVGESSHPELASMRDRTLRIAFVVVERRLERSRHEGVQVDATYRLSVESVCVPST